MSNEKVFIGCSGFSERSWKGYFYPDELPSKEYLNFYAEKLNAVEINSTFYRRPTPKTLENWRCSTGNDFKFFIKIPKTVTHIKRLNVTSQETTDFCHHIAQGLEEKLGGFLFQLPPSFQYTEENMQKVLESVDPNYLNVVEFRHTSWWNNEVYHQMKNEGVVFSGVSIPKEISDEVIINHEKFLYYRLHGVPQMFKSEYSDSELEKLSEKINSFKGTSFIFFNNTFGISGIKNALTLKKLSE